ncbi:MAG: GNAT family protein [Pseudomonadota bacterium]
MSIELADPGLENEWVRLEVFGESEKDVIAQSGAIKAMWDWMPAVPGRGTSFDAQFQFVIDEQKAGRVIPFFAYRQSDDSFVGGVSFFQPSRTHRRVQISHTWLVPDLRGTHFFRAMQLALIHRAYAWRAKRISWEIDKNNTAMQRALEKMGVQSEGILRSASRMNDGRWADVAIYAAVREEIPALIGAIEQELCAMD